MNYARELLGQLFHTLQDFYSHSNWIEMGKTDINELIGFSETIGTIAGPNQATCTNNGCTRIEKTCVISFELHSLTIYLSVFRHSGNRSLCMHVHLFTTTVKTIFYPKLILNKF